MAENKKRTIIPGWVQVAGVAIIILIAIKFCPTKKTTPPDLAAIQLKHTEDSAKSEELLRQLKKQSAANREEIRINDSIIKDNDRRLRLLLSENRKLDSLYKKKWASVQFPPSADGQTTVPQEFISDCQDCFDQLEKTTKEAEDYKMSAVAMQALYIDQSAIDSQRIDELEKERLRLNRDYNTIRIAAEVNAKYLQPRRKIKTGVAGMLNNNFLPSAIGPGLMYEDKKDRSYSAKMLFGSGQPVYIVDIFVPFSLRNK